MEKNVKYEKLSTNKITSKGVMLGLTIGLTLIIIINIFISYSKYKIEQNINLATGTINHTIPDLNALAVYVKVGEEFQKQDTIPKGYYNVLSNSYCTIPNNNEPIKDRKITYNINGTISIDIKEKGTKCWVYLEKANITSVTDLKNNLSSQTTKDCSTVTEIASTDEGICKNQDYDYQPTYAYRGASEYNYVKFANFYWRIVRINGDGSLRLIYDGTRAHANGEVDLERFIGTSAYNSKTEDAKYFGFMYGSETPSTSYDNATRNEEESTILTYLNDWYEKNLQSYENYLEKNAIFCNDRRSAETEIKWSEYLALGSVNKSGYGHNVNNVYGGRMRVSYNGMWNFSQFVDLSCQLNDMFTPTDATNGNRAMKYPIGLPTLDELLMSGVGGAANLTHYLYNGSNVLWTMTPSREILTALFVIAEDGHIGEGAMVMEYYVRPVINLKASTAFISGDGSMENPFVIN